MRTFTVILYTWILRSIFNPTTNKFVKNEINLWVFITRTPAVSRNFADFKVNMPTKMTS